MKNRGTERVVIQGKVTVRAGDPYAQLSHIAVEADQAFNHILETIAPKFPQQILEINIPVNRDGGKCEAACVHGEVDEEVHHFAHEGAKHPSLQGVDGGLERDAEDDEEEVSHAQIEYEQVGRVVSNLSAPQEYGEHQAVADGAQ
ncbi:hypothetical protein INR49_015750 [Caranx melampygus]|nr:hypothetical protein INR49_015750 [Caranx melampygus]